MKAQKKIFSREAFAVLTPEEKARMYYLKSDESNVASLVTGSERKQIEAIGVAHGWTSGRSAKQISLQPLVDCVRKNAPPEYTEEQIRARMQFDDATCAKYFKQKGNSGNRDNLAALAKNSPEAYRMLRVSAISRGYRLPELRFVAPTPQPAGDGKFILNADLARRASLPEGTRVDAQQFEMILRLVNPVEPNSND